MSHPTPRPHFPYLDGLRALAALYVVAHHVFLHVDTQSRLHGGFDVLRWGYLAVDFFIVLSGFCLMLPVVGREGTLRGGALHFLWRRAHRILPPYYAALLLSLALGLTLLSRHTGSLGDVCLPITTGAVVTHLLLVQDVTRYVTSINYALWSISVEWRIYFLFPVLVWAWRRWGGLPATAAVVILSLALFYGLDHLVRKNFAMQFVALFALGAWAASLAHAPVPAGWRRRIPWRLLLALCSAVLAGLILWCRRPGPGFEWVELAIGLWSVPLLVVVSGDRAPWLTGFLSWRPLVFVGTFSYSVYLIHGPLLQTLWQYVVHPRGLGLVAEFWTLAAVAFPAVLLLAYGFFLLFERPFLNPAPSRPG